MIDQAHPYHRILLLNFFKEGPVSVKRFLFEGSTYEITEHQVGWDFETASALIKRYDGLVDGFALGGIQKRITAGKTSFLHPGFQKLMRSAASSPLYVSDRLRHFFSEWTLQRLLKQQDHFFKGRKVLFHSAAITPMTKQVIQNGGQFACADALTLTGIPRLIRSIDELEYSLRAVRFGMKIGKRFGLKKPAYVFRKKEAVLHDWIRESDVFFTFGTLLDQMESMHSLENKTVLVDYLSPGTAEKISKVKNVKVIEFIPSELRVDLLSTQPLAVIAAVMDIERRKTADSLSEDEYLLRWIQKRQIEPAKMDGLPGPKRKCAFVIHPLSQADIWRAPHLRWAKDAPAGVKKAIEKALEQVPAFKVGTIYGVRSEATGQEVDCDLYAVMATPKQLLAMNEERVYRKLIGAAEQAASNGATLIGLGAYTKIVGDAGVSVSAGSPIPVTNGNSYSAATSIWAGELLLEKLALPSTGKAMVIGATGSIGRVSAMILAKKFKELVLVSTSPDKLLEVKREVEEHVPGVRVKITTSADSELENTEFILTATSNQSGKLFDIKKVMSGAVISDCSRPFDIAEEDARLRPDVIVVRSGEVKLPGPVRMTFNLALADDAVFACLAETVILAMDGRMENYSLSKRLSHAKVQEILELGHKHGAKLAEIQGPLGPITDEQIEACRSQARLSRISPEMPGLRLNLSANLEKDSQSEPVSL